MPPAPMEYNPEIGDKICILIAEGQSLRQVLRENDFISAPTFYKWIRLEPAFAEQYACACADRADGLFDEIFDIADDASNDWMEQNKEDNAGWRENGESVRRSAIRIDARKWALARMAPKKYGDRIDLNHGGGLTITLPKGATGV